MGRRLLWVVLAVLGVSLNGPAQVAGPEQLGQCDQGTYTITVANESSTRSACRIVVTNTVPDPGYSHVAGSATLTLHEGTAYDINPDGTFSWDVDAIIGTAYELPPGEVMTVRFDLATDCGALSGTDQVTIEYEDCSNPGVPLEDFGSISIEILPGAFVLSKLPSVVEAAVGDQVTWTVEVESTGLGPVRNVVLVDTLGPGLAYVSDSGGGQVSGQTITWSAAGLPALAEIAPGDVVSMEITAQVVACDGLVNQVDGRWGCETGQICFDTTDPTACGCDPATGAISLVEGEPFLTFTAPIIAIPYCETATSVTIPIVNTGDGTAYNLRLCGDLDGLAVSNLPANVTYDGHCFTIDQLEPGSSFDLIFDVTYSGDWCAEGPTGLLVYELDYEDACGAPYKATPRFGTITSTGGPSISVSKQGPEALRPGESAVYDVSVSYSGPLTCRGGSATSVAVVVDTYPEGFTLLNGSGGTHDPAARTVTWTFDPMVSPSFATQIELEAPTDCQYCAGPGGGTGPNVVSVAGTDCCGCPISAQASIATPILCEGFDLIELFASTVAVAPETLVRCGPDSTVTLTHTYVFDDDAALDDLSTADFTYFFEGGGEFSYVPGSLAVTGGTVAAIADGTPAGRLEITLADTGSVRGRTVVFRYDLAVLDLNTSACGADDRPLYAGIELLPGATGAGFCTRMYGNEAAPAILTIEPPAMSVAIAGVPEIQEDCATYDVTIMARRQSQDAVPKDVRLVLSNRGGSLIGIGAASCSGIAPSGGTSCGFPIVSGTTYEWRFADAFTAPGDEARITVPVTAPCGGPLIDLAATVSFDDLCEDDAQYDDTCSSSDAASALLRLEANLEVTLRPETIFAVQRTVSWTIHVRNTFNGVARNAYVDSVLGAGLAYVSSTSNPPTGVSVVANQDHSGAPSNGATWSIDAIEPGEEVTITVVAEQVGCEDLTHNVVASWGCGGELCQPEVSDSSSVLIPGTSLVATSFSPTPVNVCTVSEAIVTVRNAGVASVYDIQSHVTLPAGTQYAGNPEYRIGSGAWLPAGEPQGAPGPTLQWTSAELPALASLASKTTLAIRFDLEFACDFRGGALTVQAGYENPCGDELTSNIGRFTVQARVPRITVFMTQIPDDAIPCGGSATWEIRVANEGPVRAPYVHVVSTLDAGWSYSGSTSGGSNSGPITTWVLTDIEPASETLLTLSANSVVAGVDCAALGHVIEASWSCAPDDADCLSEIADSAFLVATRTPPVSVAATLSPQSIEACADTTTFELTISNSSATAVATFVDAHVVLPAGLSYIPGTTYIDCGSGYPGTPDPDPVVSGGTLTWYDPAVTGAGSDACEVLPAGGQIRIRFDAASACSFQTNNAQVDVEYYDCCGDTQRSAHTPVAIAPLLAQLSLTKAPAQAALDCADPGDTVTWTITITNNGSGTADWIRVTDLLGAALVLDDSDSPGVGAGLPMGAGAIGWETGPLAPGDSFSATVTAHLAVPPNDCAIALRTDTATATWGCGPADGDPNTTAEATCDSGETVQDSAAVQVPNLTLAVNDIVPVFDCVDDGIDPASGAIRITVRNTGDAAVTSDFALAVTESTTGYSETATFTSRGGTLPLAAGTAQTVSFPGWAVTCTECEYAFDVVLDPVNGLCECREDDNQAARTSTITIPDLVIDTADLSVECGADGEVRIRGPITLRNDGCGGPLTGSVRLRLRLYDGPGCGGTELQSFTRTLSGLVVPSGGGTQVRSIDVVRAIDLCDTCELSIHLEIDDDDAVCECSGTNNSLCAGTFPIAFPDLEVTGIDTGGIGCVEDGIAGVVEVTVANTGCGPAPAFEVRLVSDGCLSFPDEAVPGLAAGASTTVSFPVAGGWTDCSTCGCSLTATVDPSHQVCECAGGNNSSTVLYSSTLPDLEIAGAIASIACVDDGRAEVLSEVTVANTGCAEVSASFDIRVTLYEGPDCSGGAVDSWIERVPGTLIAAGGTRVVAMAPRTIAGSLCASNCVTSARFEVDAGGEICECDGTDNAFCRTSIPSLLPDLVITTIDPSVDCVAGTGRVDVTVENTGCGDAADVVVGLTSTGCGLALASDPIAVPVGASRVVSFAYTPDCTAWNCEYVATADSVGSVCECSGANSMRFDPYPGNGSMGDTVWYDADRDGVQGVSEDGIPGATVTLEGDLDGDGSLDVILSAVTDADGQYLFDALPAGAYTVTVDAATLPAGLEQTYDFDGLGTPNTSDYALGLDEHNREQDFGYVGTGSIGDRIWYDANADGVQDAGEDGIPGVTVTLGGDIDADGVVETVTAVTDANGEYLFDHLPAGPYTVTVDAATLPAGLEQTYDFDGLGTPNTSDYALGPGEDERGQDFGYVGTGSIGDRIWYDVNADGVQDPGEDGLPGVTVTLEGDVDADGVVETLTTTTDANGEYLFDVLPAGDYTITVDDGTLPGGLEQTYDYDGLGSRHTSDYALGAEERNREQDFGYVGTGSIGDRLWFDVNGDGVQDPGEDGIPGVTVTLEGDIDADGVIETITAVTDANGEYLFDRLPAGPYTVTVDAGTLPEGLEQTGDPDAVLDGTSMVVLGPGEDNLDQDFGYSLPALTVDKTIADVIRGGSSIGGAGPVEPGDVIRYRFVVRNIGGATAYDVEIGDTLAPGTEIKVDAPGSSGTYSVSDPVASGALGLSDGSTTFTTSLGLTVAVDAVLTAEYEVRVTSAITQGVDLVNEASAMGQAADGTPIAPENAALDDTQDEDAEDPDADDTGIAPIGVAQPALSVDKRVIDVLRNGLSIGVVDPVLFGDVIVYQVAVRNTGAATAYDVEFADVLPGGLEIETDPPGSSGAFSVDDPSSSGSLGLSDGASGFSTSISATVSGGASLTATYAVLVTPAAPPGQDIENTVTATGNDGFGGAIPEENPAAGDTSDDDAEDPDPDDTGIAIVRVGAPALVTDKDVGAIYREAGGAAGDRVEPGDLVSFVLMVTNVGSAAAHDVDVRDELPGGFSYIGPTLATWPSGSSSVAPGGVPGPILQWPLHATLQPGDALRIEFLASAPIDLAQGDRFENRFAASGNDASGSAIPADNSPFVPDDDDPDDADVVLLVGAEPALVTAKRVLGVTRGATSLGPASTVEAGDVVTYELVVSNVGDGTAYDVVLRDELPTPLVYLRDSTSATWRGLSTPYGADPVGLPGSLLLWPAGATLLGGESLVLSFEAEIDGPVQPGRTYRNTLSAGGEDGAGESIPSDNEASVPADDDPDDRDVAVLTGGGAVPALVTSKGIAAIVRDGGLASGAPRVEVGDVVRFDLAVENVGMGVAYDVSVRDALPAEFVYEHGTSRINWPLGVLFSDPQKLGRELVWSSGVALGPGDVLEISFEAAVVGPIFDGESYVNRMTADGEEESGMPIPPDRRNQVPTDIDPDDASDVALLGRSPFVQGEGGVVPVPVLRKDAAISPAAGCEQARVVVERVWFQTDVAMYAAAEYEWLRSAVEDGEYLPDTLLPTWLRTVRTQGEEYALDNLLQVDVLSGIGVPLEHGPRIVAAARAAGSSPERALGARLADYARAAGLAAERRPAGEQWIVLEYAGGDPRYTSRQSGGLWPSGKWVEVDDRVVPSALGMGLVKQVEEARRLALSSEPLDRYLALALAEVMSNKVLALDESLKQRGPVLGTYFPHVQRPLDVANGVYEVEDSDSLLFDQLSLVWGLARYAAFIDDEANGWLGQRMALPSSLRDRALALLDIALAIIERWHRDEVGELHGRVAQDGSAGSLCSTVDLGLLVTVLADVESLVSGRLRDRVTTLLAEQAERLLIRVTPEGRVLSTRGESRAAWDLAAHAAALRGLLAAYEASAEQAYLDASDRIFAEMETALWEERVGVGLFAALRLGDERQYCYTPLEVGLVVGALRELAETRSEARSAVVLATLSRFSRSVVEDAALQLSNVVGGEAASVGVGAGTISGPRLSALSAPYGVAPVLQQRLCLDEIPSESVCGGLHVESVDPWYQTDIAMYASYIVQAMAPELEDYSDANLAAVVLHSGLGVRFYDIAHLRPLAAMLDTALEQPVVSTWNPIAIPYAGGDPKLSAAADLSWDRRSFDERILASAVGMTLLRESQEALQLLSAGPSREPEWAYRSVLLAAILEKLEVLDRVRTAGPVGADYIPHALRRTSGGDWGVAADSVHLFDQIALLWGIAEAEVLLSDGRVHAALQPTGRDGVAARTLVQRLIDMVLTTLEDALLEDVAGQSALVDAAEPGTTVWVRHPEITAVNLGLAASALGRVVEAFSVDSRIGERAASLMTSLVRFVSEALWDGSGGFRERVYVDELREGACEPQTLAGQLGAIRVLLSAASAEDGGVLDRALEAFRAIGDRFWSPVLGMYRSSDERVPWCATPLELGLLIDTLKRVGSALEASDAKALTERLRQHIDRVVDGAQLQLPSTRYAPASFAAPASVDVEWYAPVFAHEACLRDWGPWSESGWGLPGDIVRYTITAENSVDVVFANLELTDVLPSHVAYVSSNPEGNLGSGTVRWAFERLEPGEKRMWEILVRVNEDAPFDEPLVNCARLTHTDLDGVPQPEREACAQVEMRASGTEGGVAEDLAVRYITDEAMYLAWVLEELGCSWAQVWPDAQRAREMSVANLGILLGESALGVPLSLAPVFSADEDREAGVASLRQRWAEESGVPRAPAMAAPIVIPFEAGTPFLQRGAGFTERRSVVTPAAVGQTLVRESQLLLGCEPESTGLTTYLQRHVAFLVGAQVQWIAEELRRSPQGKLYLPHALHLPIGEGSLTSVLLDERSLIYDQASLLLGLCRAAKAVDAVSGMAKDTASELLDHVQRHWDPLNGLVLSSMPEDGGTPAAAHWDDAAVLADALVAVREVAPGRKPSAEALLRDIATWALEAPREDDVAQEAARLCVLSQAGEALDDARFVRAGDDGAAVWLAEFIEPLRDGAAFSSLTSLGWTEAPRRVAVVLRLLSAQAQQHPDDLLRWLGAASLVLQREIIGSRLQLADPQGMWNTHTYVPCLGLAPVFAQHRELPAWTWAR